MNGFQAGPAFYLKGKAKSKRWKIEFEWTWKDWLGLCLFIVVFYAIAKGADPIKLLRELKRIIA